MLIILGFVAIGYIVAQCVDSIVDKIVDIFKIVLNKRFGTKP